jgi:hypothetical protein
VRLSSIPKHTLLAITDIDDTTLVAIVLGQHPGVIVTQHVGDSV